MGRPNPSRETKSSGANRDREISMFLVQLMITNTIGKHARLIHTLLLEESCLKKNQDVCI